MQWWLLVLLVVLNVVTVTVSNVSFKISAGHLGQAWRDFLLWQVVGNVAGFLSLVTYTLLLRQIPLRVGYALSAGLTFVVVQVLAARFIFHESVSPLQWTGAALVVTGIVLITKG